MDLASAKVYRAYSTRHAFIWAIICAATTIIFYLGAYLSPVDNLSWWGGYGFVVIVELILLFVYGIRSFAISPKALCVFTLLGAGANIIIVLNIILNCFKVNDFPFDVGNLIVYIVVACLVLLVMMLAFTLGYCRKEYYRYIRLAKGKGMDSRKIKDKFYSLKHGLISIDDMFEELEKGVPEAPIAPSPSRRRAAPRDPAPKEGEVIYSKKKDLPPAKDEMGYPNPAAYFDCKDIQGNPLRLRDGGDGYFYDIQNLAYVKANGAYMVKPDK